MFDPFDETDAVLARKLEEIAPPADLRARLLAEAPTEARPVNWWARGITAVAAVLVLTLAILSLGPHTQAKGEPIADAKSEMAKFLSSGFPLALRTDSVNQVRKWLAENHPRQEMSLPNVLAKHPTIGCRDLMWRGHKGALACFRMEGGKEAHLAMFPAKTFSDAPGDAPQIASAGGWTSAAWSQDGMTYILFVPDGMDPMKELAWVVETQLRGKIASSSSRSTACPAAKVSGRVSRISALV